MTQAPTPQPDPAAENHAAALPRKDSWPQSPTPPRPRDGADAADRGPAPSAWSIADKYLTVLFIAAAVIGAVIYTLVCLWLAAVSFGSDQEDVALVSLFVMALVWTVLTLCGIQARRWHQDGGTGVWIAGAPLLVEFTIFFAWWANLPH